MAGPPGAEDAAVRHTRQGCARGQAHGTLDRDDPDLSAGGWSPWSWSGVRQADARGPAPAWGCPPAIGVAKRTL